MPSTIYSDDVLTLTAYNSEEQAQMGCMFLVSQLVGKVGLYRHDAIRLLTALATELGQEVRPREKVSGSHVLGEQFTTSAGPAPRFRWSAEAHSDEQLNIMLDRLDALEASVQTSSTLIQQLFDVMAATMESLRDGLADVGAKISR